MCDLDRHSVKGPGIDATYHVPSAEAPISSCDPNVHSQHVLTLLARCFPMFLPATAESDLIQCSCCEAVLTTFPCHAVSFHVPPFVRQLGLPASFKPTREFYDTQEVFGLTVPRKIQASAWATKRGLAAGRTSAWATKRGLAGRNLEEIRLHELAWQGWSNHNLRALTQGRYVSIHFARSIKKATFISFLLQHVREHRLDLDQRSLRSGL